MSDIHQSLSAAERRLSEVQTVRADRLRAEKAEQQAIIDAKNQIKGLRRQKAEQDWNTAVEANRQLLAANADAVARFQTDLYRVLGEFRQLLASMDNQVEPTFRAQWQHTRQSMGAASQQMLADKMDTPDQDGKQAAIEVSFELLERARAFQSAISTETVLGLWIAQASDPDDKNARLGIVQAILSYTLDLSGVTNQQAQDKMNSQLWQQFEGRGMGS